MIPLSSPRHILAPEPDCPLCPRLAAFRHHWREKQPGWFNAPVPSFGEPDAPLLIVGLAPGLQGANRTGRPFTADYAGDLLYSTLLAYGFAKGTYAAHINDGLKLVNARIANAVRCVPPENKPTPLEARTCRPFLHAELLGAYPRKAVVALGKIAHDATIKTLNGKLSHYPFAHGAQHDIAGMRIFDSYHCSRYNTNTGRLTTEMFMQIFEAVRHYINSSQI